jgi:hypothetical protein
VGRLSNSRISRINNLFGFFKSARGLLQLAGLLRNRR